MPPDVADLPLASEFPAASRDDWRRLVDAVLKGAPYERLVGKTADGLAIEPIYPAARQARLIRGRAEGAPWGVMQRIDDPDPARANAQALTDLENGATALELVFAGTASAHGFGLPATAAALETALTDVHCDAGIALTCDLPPADTALAPALAALLKRRGTDLARTQISFGLDPIGDAVRNGGAASDWKGLAGDLAARSGAIRNLGFDGPTLVADGRIIHDAGGSEAQELAFVLASGVASLRALTEAGVSAEAASRALAVRLSADADEFLSLAKFRAIRLLWASVQRHCGLAAQHLPVHADTAWRMLTRHDPYVNILRNTIAVFSAGLGGADSIAELPHTLAIGLPDAFARRIARNLQLILLEESNLDKVSDPAAGSGGIEALTQELCETAWSLFQDIERSGGLFAALTSGLLQDKVAATRSAREKALATRKIPLTGASEFPNLGEEAATVLATANGSLAARQSHPVAIAPLAPRRLAEGFEALRDRSDTILKKHGRRPRVFLATLGTPADFTARATFARSYFEAGGIEAVTGSAADLAEAGADLVCICSSDKVYATDAAAAAGSLKQSGARAIYLAGRPGDLEPALVAAGVGGFIFAGNDVIATLSAAYDRMGL